MTSESLLNINEPVLNLLKFNVVVTCYLVNAMHMITFYLVLWPLSKQFILLKPILEVALYIFYSFKLHSLEYWT